ncbi:MAG: hypothetical protein H3Z53_09340 [archaeon]|nr:hypothetical protein [archaeon]
MDEASDKMKQVGENTEKAMKKVEDSSKKADFSMKNFAVSVSGVMTAGYSLYAAYDKVTDAQRSVEKAQYSLKQAQDAAKEAQNKYTDAVNRFGENSPEAIKALDNLRDAQDKVEIKTNDLKDRQDALSTAFLQTIPQAITGTITMMTNLKGTLVTLTQGLTSAKTAAVSLATALGSIALGAGAIFGATEEIKAYTGQTASLEEEMKALGLTQEDVQKMTLDLVASTGSFSAASVEARKKIEEMYQTWLYAQQVAADAEELLEGSIPTTDQLSATMTDLALSNEEVITASQETVTALTNVNSALSGLQTTVGGMPSFWSEKFGELSSVVSGWASSTIAQINTVVEAFRSAQEEIVGGSIWPDMWKEIERVTKKGIEANISLIGKGLETIASPVSPIAYHASPTINITSPLIAIQGSADKRTVELAANMVMKRLKSVVIESTSSASSLKRIRRR